MSRIDGLIQGLKRVRENSCQDDKIGPVKGPWLKPLPCFALNFGSLKAAAPSDSHAECWPN